MLPSARCSCKLEPRTATKTERVPLRQLTNTRHTRPWTMTRRPHPRKNASAMRCWRPVAAETTAGHLCAWARSARPPPPRTARASRSARRSSGSSPAAGAARTPGCAAARAAAPAPGPWRARARGRRGATRRSCSPGRQSAPPAHRASVCRQDRERVNVPVNEARGANLGTLSSAGCHKWGS